MALGSCMPVPPVVDLIPINIVFVLLLDSFFFNSTFGTSTDFLSLQQKRTTVVEVAAAKKKK